MLADRVRMASGGVNGISFTFVGSCVGSGSTLNFGSLSAGSIAAGDLAVYIDKANGTSGDPSAVTPSGFTNNVSTAGSDRRGMISVKKLTGSEGSVTGMNGDAFNRKIGLVFRPARSFTSIVASTPTSQITAGNPSSQVINPSSETTPVIVVGVASAFGATTSFSTASPAFDATVAAASTWMLAGYKLYTENPVSHTIDMADLTTNWLAGIYYRVTA